MANKRGNGEGSITKRKDGTWMGRLMIGRKSDGKPNIRCLYGKTRKDVQEKLTALANSVNNGSYIEPSKLIVKQWLDSWLLNYKSLTLKPKTYDSYENIIKNNINPFIGEMLIGDVKKDNIQKLVSDLVNEKNLSPATIKRIFAVLHGALKQAVYNEIIFKNPAEQATLPKQNPKTIEVFSIEQQQRFLASAKESNLYAAFLVNLDSGLRRGELLALTWKDVDFENGIITVNKNIVTTKNRKLNISEIKVQNSTKTKSGMRKVPLTQRSLLVLKELKLKQQKLSDIVFCSTIGTHIDPNNFSREFRKVIKNAGMNKFSPHVLRHTYATRLFESNVAAKTISELLGHSSITITLNIYTHVMPETKAEAVKALDLLYSN